MNNHVYDPFRHSFLDLPERRWGWRRCRLKNLECNGHHSMTALINFLLLVVTMIRSAILFSVARLLIVCKKMDAYSIWRSGMISMPNEHGSKREMA